MKTAIFTTAYSMVMLAQACGQGLFLGANTSARTRIGSIDGPFAGPGIWGQFLAGSNPASMFPVGLTREHSGMGFFSSGEVAVPGIPGGSFAFVQMVAWDGTAWGSTLAAVPADQLGRTDIVPEYLSTPIQPIFAPHFTQPAVVPPIPEPSLWALGLVGGSILLFSRRARHRRRSG